MGEIVSTIEEARLLWGEDSESFKMYKNAFECNKPIGIEAINVTEKISKFEIIEAQGKLIDELKKDYKKISREARYLSGVIGDKNNTIWKLKKKNRWNFAEVLLAVVVVGITWFIARASV